MTKPRGTDGSLGGSVFGTIVNAMDRPMIDDPIAARGPRGLSRYLPVAAVAVFPLCVGFVVWSGILAGTFGFDFLAYHQAATRLLAGLPLYDPALKSLHASSAGDVGAVVPFLYPPPFALAITPLATLSAAAASVVWLGLSLIALVGGIWLLPVTGQVRWLTLLLAGLSWPVAYSLKLGQVGPFLLLLFAIGWRWIDRPAVGVSGAIGAMVKIQPGLILVWAIVTRRRMAALAGAASIAIGAVISIVAAGGVADWRDYFTLLRGLPDPITTPGNMSPGAVVYQTLNVPIGLATAVQTASSVAALTLVLVSALRGTAASSYLAAVIASQLATPVLWDHYAMLLLLPVAWLLNRSHVWAAAIPLATCLFVLFVLPPLAYPVVFWITLVSVVAIGWRERSGASRDPSAPST